MNICTTDGVVQVRNEIHERYWPTVDVDVTGLQQRLFDHNVDFQQPLKSVRMAFFYGFPITLHMHF